MEATDFEATLEATLATRASALEVRDCLVDYLGLVGGSFVARGLSHTDPKATDATIRRMLVSRLALLWRGSESSWARPSLRDLALLRTRIEQWACVAEDESLRRVRLLLDELFLMAALNERIDTMRGKEVRQKLRCIEGGGELTPPCGELRLVGRLSPPDESSSSSRPSS